MQLDFSLNQQHRTQGSEERINKRKHRNTRDTEVYNNDSHCGKQL